MAALKKYLTISDVCECLRVSRSTVERLVASGDLRPARLRVTPVVRRRPGVKPRPRPRFDPEEIERYVRRCTADAGKREASRLHPLERVRRDYDALTHDERQALLEFIRRDLDKGQP